MRTDGKGNPVKGTEINFISNHQLKRR
jgi:hypothetical protein